MLQVMYQRQSGDALLAIDDVQPTALARVATFLMKDDAAQVKIMRWCVVAEKRPQVLQQPRQLFFAPAVRPLILGQLQMAKNQAAIVARDSCGLKHIGQGCRGNSDTIHLGR
ncbi:hypothetical protein D3C72_921070 [compost metagenome]